MSFTLVDDAPSAPAAPSAGRFRLIEDEPRSTMDEVGRQVGLTGRAAVNAVAGTVGVLSDPIAATINLLTGSDIPFARQLADSLMTRAGMPQPENKTERIVGAATEGAASAAGMVGAGRLLAGAASPVAQTIGNALAAGPGMQTLSGATGAGNAARVRENGGGAVDQAIAGLVGSAAPLAAQAAGSAIVRGAVRGGEAGRQVMADRVSTIEQAGAEPTVGLATGNRRMQATESALSRLPGSAGPIAKAAGQVSDDMGARVSDIAEGVSKNADPTVAGLRIESGVKNFVSRFKGEQQFLYNKLDQYIPGAQPVNVSNTQAAFQRLASTAPGAPETSAVLQNPKIARLAAAFDADTAATGQIPYEALKKVRSAVGEAIADGPLVSNAPSGQLKDLYGALSRDMEAAAAAAGPDAQKALTRANTFTRAGMDRIESHLNRLVGKTGDETFNALVRGGDSSKIAATLKSLEPAERDVVKATVVDRLGKAVASQQGADGAEFSAQTFLTNWNKLDSRSKAVLFAGGTLREDLDKVARTAEMLREQSRVFANPSGTAASMYNIGAVATGVGGLMTGNLGTAGALLTAMGAANLTGRLMTNPDFVRWLARSTTMPPAALPSAIGSLNRIAEQAKDEGAAEEMRSVIRSLSGAGQ